MSALSSWPARSSVRVRDGRASSASSACACALGEPDASGRRRPVPVQGSEFFVPADTVLTASARPRTAPPARAVWPDERRDPRRSARAGGRPGSSSRAATSSSSRAPVAQAIGSGKRAAIGIDRALRAKAGEARPERDVDTAALRPGAGTSA